MGLDNLFIKILIVTLIKIRKIIIKYLKGYFFKINPRFLIYLIMILSEKVEYTNNNKNNNKMSARKNSKMGNN